MTNVNAEQEAVPRFCWDDEQLHRKELLDETIEPEAGLSGTLTVYEGGRYLQSKILQVMPSWSTKDL